MEYIFDLNSFYSSSAKSSKEFGSFGFGFAFLLCLLESLSALVTFAYYIPSSEEEEGLRDRRTLVAKQVALCLVL